jgi:hypothetical protein
VSESCPPLDRSASLTLLLSLRLCRTEGIFATQRLYASLPQRQMWTLSPHRRVLRLRVAPFAQKSAKQRTPCGRGVTRRFADGAQHFAITALLCCGVDVATTQQYEPRAGERMASSTIRRCGSIPGSRKPITANTEPARIYRIRNGVSRR